MSRQDGIDCFNDLILVCLDGERGFRRCADLASDPTLKAMFRNRADSCAEAAAELQQMVVMHGGEPSQTSSITGSLHRRWIDLQMLFNGDDDGQLLEECDRGEAVALEAYREALRRDLPSDAIAMIERQYQGVQRNCELIRGWSETLRRQQ